MLYQPLTTISPQPGKVTGKVSDLQFLLRAFASWLLKKRLFGPETVRFWMRYQRLATNDLSVRSVFRSPVLIDHFKGGENQRVPMTI